MPIAQTSRSPPKRHARRTENQCTTTKGDCSSKPSHNAHNANQPDPRAHNLSRGRSSCRRNIPGPAPTEVQDLCNHGVHGALFAEQLALDAGGEACEPGWRGGRGDARDAVSCQGVEVGGGEVCGEEGGGGFDGAVGCEGGLGGEEGGGEGGGCGAGDHCGGDVEGG